MHLFEMSNALFNVLKYNFIILGFITEQLFNSDFHHDSKNLEKIERKPRMDNSANGRNLWN